MTAHADGVRVTTSPYKLTPGRIGRRGVDLWLGRWWWACALPLTVLLAGAIFDVRLFIAAIALALILYPAILMFAFYGYGLSPATSRLIIEQTATFGPDAITIDYLAERPIPSLAIPYKSITKVTDTGASLTITYADGQWLEIPAAAFPPSTFDTVLSMIHS